MNNDCYSEDGMRTDIDSWNMQAYAFAYAINRGYHHVTS